MSLLDGLLDLIRQSDQGSEREALAHAAIGAVAALRVTGVLSDEEAEPWAAEFVQLARGGRGGTASSRVDAMVASALRYAALDQESSEDDHTGHEFGLVACGLVLLHEKAPFQPVSIETYRDRVIVRWVCRPDAWETAVSSTPPTAPFTLSDSVGTLYRSKGAGAHAFRDGPVFGVSSFTPAMPEGQRTLTLRSSGATWTVAMQRLGGPEPP